MSTTIRIRGPGGTTTLTLPEGSTLATLQGKIHEFTAIPPSEQELRIGFPPKPITEQDGSASLSSVGISTGEQILVARKAGSEPTRPIPTRVEQRTTVPDGSRIRSVPVSDGGALVLRVVPDDNSCLFTSVGIVLRPGQSDTAPELRKLVAETVMNDQSTWSSAILGRPPADYAATILRPTSWGGAIELSIFASAFHTEVWSIDVASSRVDRFGEGQGYDRAVMVVYSGIHYDALTLAPAELLQAGVVGTTLDFDTTSFSITNGQADELLVAANTLVAGMRAEHAYTDTATFLLRCQQCQLGIKGEKEARSHAEQTGHTQFGEYDES